ncbi:hypothetical protein GQ457_01G013630 [Hibiscus cannabinus]
MFPLDVSTMENFALAANAKDDSELWHLRYGHLSVKGLKLLSDKDQFLVEAVATSVYLLNLSPTRAVLNRTPYKAWYERRPSVMQQDIPVSIGVSLDGKEESVGTISATDLSTTTTNASISATPSRDPPSSTALEESSEETPPRKYRSLTDIYASCQFALNVSDPIHNEDAAEREEWHRAMMEEMNATEKNGTWEMTDLPVRH